MSVDVIVLGAGMVGTSVALQLAERGRSVVLVDRRGIGEETSFGNAGVVEREGLVPVGVPYVEFVFPVWVSLLSVYLFVTHPRRMLHPQAPAQG